MSKSCIGSWIQLLSLPGLFRAMTGCFDPDEVGSRRGNEGGVLLAMVTPSELLYGENIRTTMATSPVVPTASIHFIKKS